MQTTKTDKYIFRLSIYLSANKFQINKTAFYYTETNSSYLVDRTSDFGGKQTRVNRNKMLVIDSMLIDNNYTTIQYFTWCMEGDIPVMTTNLIEKAEAKIRDIEKHLSALKMSMKNIKINQP
jgi:hypothetical protein